ncbi:MAG: bifunctional phosphopantothenoylcysteine decarboxylase/phosphopantothenate--cysteine ligase CoaBC [Acidimicrobiales bacterium]
MSPAPVSALAERRVVLGVCGGIAAYKAVELCRRLTSAGALVSPVLTAGARRFVGVATFNALASEPARTSMFKGADSGANPAPHVQLGRSADAVVVAPATARFIASYACGISSDLLTATLLVTRAPVLVCPSMHSEMWQHPAVQDNLSVLRRRGVHVLEPAEGRLAGGDVGKGRLPEPEDIVVALSGLLKTSTSLRGVRAVVSAGGTREPIDPVRFIGNRSSGKQGHALAAELASRGAEVCLVTASEREPPAGVSVVRVATAAEMADAVLSEAERSQVVVMAAAVADFRPALTSVAKIKKSSGPPQVQLVPTLDILAELGARRRPDQVLVGFAAETASGPELLELGRSKLAQKGVDLLVANDVAVPGAGFGEDHLSAVMVSPGSSVDLGMADKQVVAAKVVDAVTQLLGEKQALSRSQGAAL